jgi:hypothetical protein
MSGTNPPPTSYAFMMHTGTNLPFRIILDIGLTAINGARYSVCRSTYVTKAPTSQT